MLKEYFKINQCIGIREGTKPFPGLCGVFEAFAASDSAAKIKNERSIMNI
jgi:hypothetical protein